MSRLDVSKVVSGSTPVPGGSPRTSGFSADGGVGLRRTVLKAIAGSALAVGGNVLSWGARTSPAQAETSPDGSLGWDVCRVNYTPDADTSGDYVNWGAACNGANFRSSIYCNSGGWHRKDYTSSGFQTRDYIRVHDRCWSPSDGRTSWRWVVASSGNEFRCSDGKMIVTNAGSSSVTYTTVCRRQV